MRLVFALLSTLAAGCTAIDDFDRFTFGDMGPLPGFGEPCNGQCAVGNVDRPLECYSKIGDRDVPGGMCTRACNILLLTSCSDYPDAVCVHVQGIDICLQRCNPSINVNCRTGFSCCDSMQPVNGPGACAPPETDLCH
jgi:hypothetical protein